MDRIPRSGFNWHELMTTDTAAAKDFYREVAGVEVAPGPYQMLMADGKPIGGLVGPGPEGPKWPSGGPEPHWIAYLGVKDVDIAVEKATAMGGRVFLPPTDVPGFGRVAGIRDQIEQCAAQGVGLDSNIASVINAEG